MLKHKAQRNLSNEIVPRQFTDNDLKGFKYYKNNVYKKFLRKTARKEKRNLKKKAKA